MIYIPHLAWDEPRKSWHVLSLLRVTMYCFSFVEDNCDIFQFLPCSLDSIFRQIFFFYFVLLCYWWCKLVKTGGRSRNNPASSRLLLSKIAFSYILKGSLIHFWLRSNLYKMIFFLLYKMKSFSVSLLKEWWNGF